MFATARTMTHSFTNEDGSIAMAPIQGPRRPRVAHARAYALDGK